MDLAIDAEGSAWPDPARTDSARERTAPSLITSGQVTRCRRGSSPSRRGPHALRERRFCVGGASGAARDAV